MANILNSKRLLSNICCSCSLSYNSIILILRKLCTNLLLFEIMIMILNWLQVYEFYWAYRLVNIAHNCNKYSYFAIYTLRTTQSNFKFRSQYLKLALKSSGYSRFIYLPPFWLLRIMHRILLWISFWQSSRSSSAYSILQTWTRKLNFLYHLCLKNSF